MSTFQKFRISIIQGFKVKEFFKRLAKLLAEEWDKPYLIVRGLINDRLGITLIRTTSQSIRISWILASHMSNRFSWKEVQVLDF